MKKITDPSFRYTNAASTNIKWTFARVRRERAAAERAKAEALANVRTIGKKVTKEN